MRLDHGRAEPSQAEDAGAEDGPPRGGSPARIAMLVGVVGLFALQLVGLSVRFDPHSFGLSLFLAPHMVALLKTLAPALTGFVVAFVWLRRAELTGLVGLDRAIDCGAQPGRGRRPWLWLGVSLSLFSAAALAPGWDMPTDSARGAPMVVGLFLVWLGLGLAGLLALAGVVAPMTRWFALATTRPDHTALSLGAGGVLAGLVVVFQSAWGISASGAMWVSHALLSVLYDGVVIVPDERVLGVGEFLVIIAPNCSGLEGVALILAFTCGYLFSFRRDLLFPRALLLIPLGVAVMWLLNTVRIASLIMIGHHVSPDLAVGGFHSQAGWMMFLAASFLIMGLAHASGLFTAPGSASSSGSYSGAGTANGEYAGATPGRGAYAAAPLDGLSHQATALLAPFLAMMLASVVEAAFSNGGYGLYGLKVLAVGAVVIGFRGAYAALLCRVSPLSLLVGFGVGVAWIVTAPGGDGGGDGLRAWLVGLGPLAYVSWLGVRFVGTAVLVPIAEELAFRGYVLGKLKTLRIAHVPPMAVSVFAVLVSSALFGVFHARWLAAFLAGLVFAALTLRKGQLGDAVLAHMAANALIFVWAVVADDWALL